MDNSNTKLVKSLEDFMVYVDSNYKISDKTPVTSGDLAEFGHQVYYTLSEFIEHISPRS